MSVESMLSNSKSYLDYKPSQHPLPLEGISPLTRPTPAYTHNTPIRFSTEVQTGCLRQSFEFPKFGRPSLHSLTPLPPIRRTHAESKDIEIVWSHHHGDNTGLLMIKEGDDRFTIGDRVFCQRTFGNGQILKVEGWTGRYAHLVIQFHNTRGSFSIQRMVILTSRIKLRGLERILSFIAFLNRPFFHLRECECDVLDF
jgi:hypothetical protein